MNSIVYRQIQDSLTLHLHLEPREVYISAARDFYTALVLFLQASYAISILLLAPLFHGLSLAFKHLLPHVKSGLQQSYNYQLSLPRHVHLLELAFLLFLLVCYMAKKFIQRKRYIPRLLSHVAAKKRAIRAAYLRHLARVAAVNATVATLLPHAIYFVICVLLTKFANPIVAWFAEGYSIELLSVVYPIFGTISVVQATVIAKQTGLTDGTILSTPAKTASKTPSKPAPAKSAPGSRSRTPTLTSPLGSIRVGGGTRRASTDGTDLSPSPDEDLYHAIMYWVVFAVSTATYTTLSLIPVVGRYTASLHAYALPARLFFFLWLHLPMNATEFLYEYMCPFALRFADSTFDAADKNDNVAAVINKLCSFLSLAAMVGLCGPKTRDRATIVLRESLSLLPAVVCLGMPSMFVRFGIVYAALLVPAANAAKGNGVGGGNETQVRWAKYFCVYAVVSCGLKAFESYLWWVPFSTHATLVVFMWLALPGMGACEVVYRLLVDEAVGIGIVEKEEGAEGKDTLLVRGIRALSRGGKKAGEEVEGDGAIAADVAVCDTVEKTERNKKDD